jgi:hypothetical protein
MMGLEFEWDQDEAKRNLKKHGVSFEEASTIFVDPLSSTIPDQCIPTLQIDSSSWENRIGDDFSSWLLRIAVRRFESSVHESRGRKSGETMTKGTKKRESAEMLDEYDFRGGARGKYAKRYAEGTNVVVLDPDIAAVFPDSKSVNYALRALVKSSRRNGKAKAK